MVVIHHVIQSDVPHIMDQYATHVKIITISSTSVALLARPAQVLKEAMLVIVLVALRGVLAVLQMHALPVSQTGLLTQTKLVLALETFHFLPIILGLLAHVPILSL